MGSYPATEYCYEYLLQPVTHDNYIPTPYVNLTNVEVVSLQHLCRYIYNCESNSETEGEYSQPMVLIGMYISIASLLCILAMALDLLNGFRNRKFWFPTKYFSLNAASITVIAVAMKLPVDLSTPMPTALDQAVKIGGLAFLCTMMSNLLPSLASMDDKSLLANVIGLSILVVTIVANILIQIRTKVIYPYFLFVSFPTVIIPCIYMGMLLFLLMILISSAIMIPTSKKILEFKYQATSKTTINNQHPQENLISIIEKLRHLVKKYWIMAETGNPQFMMASNPLSYASGIICAISLVIYIFVVWELVLWQKTLSKVYVLGGYSLYGSAYKGSIVVVGITQCIGIVVGSVAPIFRCFTVLSFKSFTNQNKKHFLVFKVEKYWTQKLYEWKESHISFLLGGRRSRALLHNLKNIVLSFCMGFQKATVVSCKIIALIPIVAIIFVVYCSYYFKSVKMMFPPSTSSSRDDTNEDLSNYVLLLEDNMRLAEKTIKGISDSMNFLIRNAEKRQRNINLLNLLEESVAFDGVEMFDTDHIQSQLCVQHVNTWSLPIISLTCIAIALPNIHEDRANNLFKSVGEGLLYTHLVEESLNKTPEYVNIRKTSLKLWHEIEDNYKWLETTLKRSVYGGKTPIEIIKSFAHVAEEIVSDFNTSTNREPLEKENLPQKLVVANSMYRITQTIIHTYEINNSEIIEHELFTRLSHMIADILAACLTNIPRVVTIRCHESTIEKREARVAATVNLLGRTTEIIKRLEKRELPNMDPNKLGFIDEWRLHLKQQ